MNTEKNTICEVCHNSTVAPAPHWFERIVFGTYTGRVLGNFIVQHECSSCGDTHQTESDKFINIEIYKLLTNSLNKYADE